MEFVRVVSETARRSFEARLAIYIGGVQLPHNPHRGTSVLAMLGHVGGEVVPDTTSVGMVRWEPRWA